MSFPTITFKHTNMSVDYELQGRVTEKFQSLERYIRGKSDARCAVEFAKVTPQQHGPVYRVEVNIWSDGVLYRAEATKDSFDAAIDSVRSELDSELGRARTRRMSLWRKGARKMKEMMQRSN